MFDTFPDSIAFRLGPVAIGWYGVCYAIGLAVAYVVLVRLARKAGEDPDVVGNGIIIVAIAALVGGRLYHVIDQWHLYANDPLKIILPPYSGLGVYGGIITGTIAGWWYARRRRVSFARWADIVAPALFVMQAIGRWGNYFNQELYGPPTTLPWGIPIDCAHRLLDKYACSAYPELTTRFHPLFLYESISGVVGALFIYWLGSRYRHRLRSGDLLLVFFIWYGTTRFVLENLRADNWTFFGVPVAQIVSIVVIAIGVAGLIHRHRPRHGPDRPPAFPDRATWGALGATWMTKPIDEPWANVPPMRHERATGDDIDEDDDIDDGATDDIDVDDEVDTGRVTAAEGRPADDIDQPADDIDQPADAPSTDDRPG